MSEELIQRVTKVIATSKRIPVETVTIDSEFAQLGIDSMDAVEILFALEGEFAEISSLVRRRKRFTSSRCASAINMFARWNPRVRRSPNSNQLY